MLRVPKPLRHCRRHHHRFKINSLQYLSDYFVSRFELKSQCVLEMSHEKVNVKKIKLLYFHSFLVLTIPPRSLISLPQKSRAHDIPTLDHGGASRRAHRTLPLFPTRSRVRYYRLLGGGGGVGRRSIHQAYADAPRTHTHYATRPYAHLDDDGLSRRRRRCCRYRDRRVRTSTARVYAL